jgi:hypothetical protein
VLQRSTRLGNGFLEEATAVALAAAPLKNLGRTCPIRHDAFVVPVTDGSHGPEPEETTMAQYLMAVYGPMERSEFGEYGTKEAMEQAYADTGAFNQRLVEAGHFVYANGLEPATSATVVDGQGAEPVFTDGPYLESKEHLGGFWIIEAADLDVALRLAAEGSKACRGKVEVRPFHGA